MLDIPGEVVTSQRNLDMDHGGLFKTSTTTLHYLIVTYATSNTQTYFFKRSYNNVLLFTPTD